MPLLKEHNKRLFIHGHTHREQIWRIGPSGAMTPLHTRIAVIDSRARYIIGVESVGQPESDTEPGYALYDEKTGQIELCQVGSR